MKGYEVVVRYRKQGYFSGVGLLFEGMAGSFLLSYGLSTQFCLSTRKGSVCVPG